MRPRHGTTSTRKHATQTHLPDTMNSDRGPKKFTSFTVRTLTWPSNLRVEWVYLSTPRRVKQKQNGKKKKKKRREEKQNKTKHNTNTTPTQHGTQPSVSPAPRTLALHFVVPRVDPGVQRFLAPARPQRLPSAQPHLVRRTHLPWCVLRVQHPPQSVRQPRQRPVHAITATNIGTAMGTGTSTGTGTSRSNSTSSGRGAACWCRGGSRQLLQLRLHTVPATKQPQQPAPAAASPPTTLTTPTATATATATSAGWRRFGARRRGRCRRRAWRGRGCRRRARAGAGGWVPWGRELARVGVRVGVRVGEGEGRRATAVRVLRGVWGAIWGAVQPGSSGSSGG